jgi:uncharacterized glyoxalase superfamily protein PhnB
VLRCELFVADLDASVDFYRRCLAFVPVGAASDTRSELMLGKARLSLQARTSLPTDHYFDAEGFTGRVGTGVEIVVEVDDLAEAYDHMVDSGWRRYEPLQARPWGADDFRVVDPDGYYLRVTGCPRS